MSVAQGIFILRTGVIRIGLQGPAARLEAGTGEKPRLEEGE